jgi:hypothetical protein
MSPLSPDSLPPHHLREPATPPTSPSSPSLLHLPLELQFLITSHLPWPDLLALRHTHPHFYHNVPTTVRQRVAWLISLYPYRPRFPRENVNMKTDADFCRSHEIQRLLVMRRRHLDCPRDGKRCLVVEGRACPPRAISVVKKGMRAVVGREALGGLSYWGLSLRDVVLLWAMFGLLIAVLVASLVSNSKARLVWHSEAKSWFS